MGPKSGRNLSQRGAAHSAPRRAARGTPPAPVRDDDDYDHDGDDHEDGDDDYDGDHDHDDHHDVGDDDDRDEGQCYLL